MTGGPRNRRWITRVVSRMRSFFPTKEQWEKWSFPTKLGVVSAYVGIIGFLITVGLILVPILANLCPGSCDEPLSPLPGGSGWLLVGDYDLRLQMYTRGPFYKMVKSNYDNPSHFPRKGEKVEITALRKLIILDFQPNANISRLFDSPMMKASLESRDYTGIEILSGTCVEVRDVRIASTYEMPAAVWIRIGKPPEK